MTRYAVTGVHRELDPREENLVRLVLASKTDLTELTTGCAGGVDTLAFYAGLEVQKHARHRICIPGAPHNKSLVIAAGQRKVIMESCPVLTTAADSYMARNEALVRNADILLAFPETDSEELRSGTWSTVRRARRAGVGIEIHPLNGHAPEDGHGVHLRRKRRRRSSGKR